MSVLLTATVLRAVARVVLLPSHREVESLAAYDVARDRSFASLLLLRRENRPRGHETRLLALGSGYVVSTSTFVTLGSKQRSAIARSPVDQRARR